VQFGCASVSLFVGRFFGDKLITLVDEVSAGKCAGDQPSNQAKKSQHD
jgi:hypothetical protein